MSRLHRFYFNHIHNKYGDIGLTHSLWINDKRLLDQWRKVLRYQIGQQVVLFDGIEHEKLYEIDQLDENGVHLKLITEFERKLPKKEIYLFWSLLKKDKNDWVLQKCTELGVSHFIPLVADRSEKTGFDSERAQKIVIEAAEQCGRSDIPRIREPIDVQSVFNEFQDKITLVICEQNHDNQTPSTDFHPLQSAGLLIGPEGGWSDAEKDLFKGNAVQYLNLHDFTLRAETACLTAVAKLLH